MADVVHRGAACSIFPDRRTAGRWLLGSNDELKVSILQNTYINEKEAARHLALEHQTLARWRWAGKGPQFYKVGGAVRYKVADLEAFVQPQGGIARECQAEAVTSTPPAIMQTVLGDNPAHRNPYDASARYRLRSYRTGRKRRQDEVRFIVAQVLQDGDGSLERWIEWLRAYLTTNRPFSKQDDDNFRQNVHYIRVITKGWRLLDEIVREQFLAGDIAPSTVAKQIKGLPDWKGQFNRPKGQGLGKLA